MIVDLHCHSNVSDGQLTPDALVRYADSKGIGILAITDHDSTKGIPAALSVARMLGIDLIPGIELSSQWRGVGVHVVGLGVDIEHRVMKKAVERQSARRQTRARDIGARLAKLGIEDSFDGAARLAGESQIGRPHFAQYLVEQGVVKDLASAYKKYLGAGKAGDIKSHWPALEEVVDWIVSAGGYAVLAHPAKYKLTRMKLRALCGEFREAGGQALEVVSGMQDKAVTQWHEQLCSEFNLYASCGSDFHGPATRWSDLGKMVPLPDSCRPIWSIWR